MLFWAVPSARPPRPTPTPAPPDRTPPPEPPRPPQRLRLWQSSGVLLINQLHDRHEAPRGLIDSSQDQAAGLIGRLVEEAGPRRLVALGGVEGLDHGQVAHAQEGLLDGVAGAWGREHGVHDQQAGARVRFERAQLRAQDRDRVRRGPVVQDHPEQVHVCALLWLRGEEVVALGSDPCSDRLRLCCEYFGALSDGVWEVLDEEVELRKCLGEGDAGTAGGAANLDAMLMRFLC